MANIHFEIPIWVQHKKEQYIIRPLFHSEWYAADERYENAIRKLTQLIRKEFSQYRVERDNSDELLWLLFNPEFKFESIDFDFNYGQRFFNGKLSVAWFIQGEYTVVLLPAFGNYQFISRKPNARRSDVVEEVIQQVQIYARKYTKKKDEEFILDGFASGKGEFCTTLDLHMFVPGEKILGDTNNLFQQFFRSEISFDGRREIVRVGHDLNDWYPTQLSRAYFSDLIVEQLKTLLYNRENIPVVLIGDRKVGKTTILHEVVYRHVEEHADKQLSKLDNVWNVDPSRIIAGMSIVGAWQRRFEAIIRFVMHPLEKNPRQDKLYFTNIVSLFRIGKSSQNSMTLSDVLKPYLQGRRLQVILEATPEEWAVVSEIDRGFTDLFKVIRLYEPDETTGLKIISKLRNQLEQEHQFGISNLALVRLIELQKRFHISRGLVGVVAESLHQLATKYAKKEIDVQTIISEFSSQTHLNERLANQDIRIGRTEFADYLAERLIGQPEAVDCLTDVLNVIKAQLNNPERPFGAFLFIGPTGVGKTQAAKILARYLFTHDESLVRFDMNEFIDDDAVNRLVGDFTNPEGQLTTKIRYNSFCVLLFDEIEKAHPDVHNLLLQILGEGRLTDALGRTVSFCNTVIIMTSNLGAERVGKEINLQRREDITTRTYEKAVRDFFRPEFINRIDRIVFFQKLTSQHIGLIAWLQIKELLKRHGFLRRHTILNVSPEVLEAIAQKGFDPEMGGRALKRQIEKELTVLIADKLVLIAPDKPVIFSLFHRDGQFMPHLTLLEHIPRNETSELPNLENLEITFDLFAELLETVEDIKEELLEMDQENSSLVYSTETNKEASQLMYFKESLTEIEAKLTNILWEYQAGKKMNIAKTVLPLKSVSGVKRIRNYGWNGEGKVFLTELYSQLEISDYFNEIHESAARIVNETNALYFYLSQDIAWLDFNLTCYVEQRPGQILLRIASAVGNSGSNEIEYMEKMYRTVFGLTTKVKQEKGYIYLHIHATGVYHLFQQEVGFHMFFSSHETSVPVEVSVYPVETGSDINTLIYEIEKGRKSPVDSDEQSVSHIVRLYVLGDGKIKRTLITDLRSGIVHNKDLTYQELKWLFYANTITQDE
ncbi:AAA family ATPase [Cytophagaceae bacterium YF14B1]|uniref:AAA family ATPase n=1 Tax=Xanthocytophaga flava TaxID=3048013 RepID=A0AAE3QNP1_9BACT|nr:AAA family ATPase [Xanthocytophaga flavus]MDJ1482031.1 AAA family ATPase [Xanthocytophaga flavus]